MRLVLAATAVIATAATIGVFAYVTDAPKPVVAPLRPAACDDAEGVGVERAGSIAGIFVTSTVVAVNGKRSPECSYDLITAEVRRGKSRAEWRQANPIEPFLTDARESMESGLVPGTDVVVEYRDQAGRECAGEEVSGCWARRVQAELFISGARKRELVQELFLIRLVWRGRWLVDYWGPLVEPGGFGPSAMTE